MPRTIDEGFSDFIKKLTPSPVESEAAKTHRASIQSALKNEFGLNRFFRSGSFGNGTSISGFSDVDYFASIPQTSLKENSTSSLTAVRNCLNNRFPSTGVRVSCPAVKVPFGSKASESTEVVPADFIKKDENDHHIYDIPNCSGGWMRSSPDAHNEYVRNINNNFSGNKVKSLIRLIKAWKYFNNVQISSFYLEMRVAKYASAENSIVYYIDLMQIFKEFDGHNLARLQDPVGISGYIVPTLSSAKLSDAQSKVSTALSRATNAFEAVQKGDIKDAFYWWNLIFANRFPSYYY